ncbi:MAG: M23 family metallopeptidase [Chthoniobacterales bacterium]|jgi:murein DD-endopeptidase MepM/ murein hydrolase activator NlpD
MIRVVLSLAAALLAACSLYAQENDSTNEHFQYAPTRSADGFDMPVGKPNADDYYRSRGLIIGHHLGDDWNGNGGGNTDLGAPVYSTAHGLTVYAKDARMGWGNLVIIRHAYWGSGRWNYVDSVYAHLKQIFVREGQQIRRGQLVGSIGTNHGMYAAHLHFEIRKNLRIGVNQGSYRKDLSNYYKPHEFIADKRQLKGGGVEVKVPINTFRLQSEVVDVMGHGDTPSKPPKRQEPAPSTSHPEDPKNGDFRVNRFN